MNLPHLRGIRKRAILSQEELAAKSGVARDTISKLETGRRKAYPSTIRKLAGGLQIEPRMLMGDVETEPGMQMGGVEYLDEQVVDSGDEAVEKDTERDGAGRKVGF